MWKIFPEFVDTDFYKIFIFNLFFLLFFIIFIIFINFILQKAIINNHSYKKYNFRWWVLPLVIFFIESFSTFNFFNKIGGGSAHHWQVYISTLELMKNGGYLLWDTPSQYGFLNLISIYLMPFNDPWMKLYIFNSFLKFITSLIIFKVVWNNKNIYWYIFSILLVWSSFFILSSGPALLNSSETPSSGALRYFWVIILLFMISRIKYTIQKKEILSILSVWLLGFFWSITSAFCVSVIIAPYLIYIFFSQKISIIKKIIILFIFPGSLLIIIFFISLYYFINIGNNPDYFAFFDYAIHSVGFLKENFDYTGAFLIPIFIFSWSCIELLKIKHYKDKYVLLSLILGLWAICLYSFDWGTNLVHLKHFYLYIFIVFLIINLLDVKGRHILIFSPLLIVINLLCFTNPKTISHIINTFNHQDYSLNNVVFNENKDFNKILSFIKPGDIPITYLESGRYLFFNFKNFYFNEDKKLIKINRNYLPLFFGAASLTRLNKDTRMKYSQRWLKRNKFNRAWFINPTDDPWHYQIQADTELILKKNGFKIKKNKTLGIYKAILYEK